MKIILLTDVAKVGKRGDIKDVNDGYARNFLIARKLAEPATPGAVARLEKSRKTSEEARTREEERLIQVLGQFKTTPLEIIAKATPEGHLFAGISREKIAELLSQKGGGNFPADTLMVEKPLKGVGDHEITANIGDVRTTFHVNIKAAS